MIESYHETKRIRRSRNEHDIKKRLTFAIIGGGISGVCCAQELARLHENETYDIILISATDVLKESIGVMKISKHLEEFSVFEKKADFFKLDNPNITCIEGVMVNSIDTTKKLLYLNNNTVLDYWKVCICSGATPKLIINHPNVIGIRDLQTVQELMERVKKARKVVVIGNGGIALELIHALDFVDVDWYIKDDYVGNTFFDATASAFIMPSLLARANMHDNNYNNDNNDNTNHNIASNNNNNDSNNDKHCGAALGPEWLSKNQHLLPRVGRSTSTLTIHFHQEVIAIKSTGQSWQVINNNDNSDNNKNNNKDDDNDDDMWPLCLRSSNNEILGCDFIISATGVIPAPVIGQGLELDDDGAIIVNENMETSVASVFAAGDCCSYQNNKTNTPINDTITYWFQMRLWTQARAMGIYAAHCMSGVQDNYGSDFFLELFAHVTRFFGFKVVLLGRYNGQGLGLDIENAIKEIAIEPNQDNNNENKTKKYETSHISDITNQAEIWTRVTPNVEYIKIIIKEGKVIGALLIGDTNLEEVFENLILNQLDVSALGSDILNPDIDIEDYFD